MKAGQSVEAATQTSRLFQWIKSILRDEFDSKDVIKCKQEHTQQNIKQDTQVMIIALKSVKWSRSVSDWDPRFEILKW